MTNFPVSARLTCSHTIKLRFAPLQGHKFKCPHGCGYQVDWDSFTTNGRMIENHKAKEG